MGNGWCGVGLIAVVCLCASGCGSEDATGGSGSATSSGGVDAGSDAVSDAASNGATTDGGTSQTGGDFLDTGLDTAQVVEDTTAPEDTTPPEDTTAPEDTAPLEDTSAPEDTAPPEDTRPEGEDTRPCLEEATAWLDNDGDGQGDRDGATTTYCLSQDPPEGYSPNRLDCDDDDPEVFTGQYRCAEDGSAVELCVNGEFRDFEVCGFEKSCYQAPDGFQCGCAAGSRRCEDWVVRFCAPDRSGFLAHDCRDTGGVCEDNDCQNCTVEFAFRDGDRDGEGDLREYVTYCVEAGVPEGYVTNSTDCRDDDRDVGDGDRFCDPDGFTVRGCEEGRVAEVERCPDGCLSLGQGMAGCAFQ